MLKMNIENPLTRLVSGFSRVKIGVKCSKLTNLKSVKKKVLFFGYLQITKSSIPTHFAKSIYHLLCLCIFLLRHNRFYFNKFCLV